MSVRYLFPTLSNNLNKIDELLAVIGANFQVEKRPIFHKAGIGPMGQSGVTFHPIVGYSTVVRQDNLEALGVVSARYGVSQYDSTLRFLDELVAEGEFQYNGGRVTLGGAHLFVSLKAQNRVVFA